MIKPSVLALIGFAALVACVPAASGSSAHSTAPAGAAISSVAAATVVVASSTPSGPERLQAAPPIAGATPASAPWVAPAPPSGSDPVLVGAGDIAPCEADGPIATARLLEAIPGTIFTAGDNAYPDGSASQFANCFGRTWGRFKARIRPSPGNHDYGTPGAAAYFRYFGAAAGEPSKGYYSYDLGSWHIIALNSNCSEIGGCNAGSEQERWLRADLAANPAVCTLAYWHHPRFSSGQHGNAGNMGPIWQALYDAGVDVVVSGHDHDYERFAPLNPKGGVDRERGIREFVVGTGGVSLRPFGPARPGSETRDAATFGVVKFTLHQTSYDWEFIPETGKSFTDSGSGVCHGRKTPPPTRRPGR